VEFGATLAFYSHIEIAPCEIQYGDGKSTIQNVGDILFYRQRLQIWRQGDM